MYSILKKMTPLFIALAAAGGCATAMGKSVEFSAAEKLLDEQQWQAAQERFKALSQNEQAQQDAALYWLAYAQYKNNQAQAALKSLSALNRRFPESRWLNDAKALSVEIKDKTGEVGEIEDDELKLYAINALMNRPSDKAVTLLGDILNGDSSKKLAKRALFVLSQMNNEQAFEMVKRTAANDQKPMQQIEALKVMGLMSQGRGTRALQDIYKSTQNFDAKYRILKSLMTSNANEALLDAAKTEQDDKLKTKAIKLLGNMSASPDLWTLYKDPAFTNQRITIIKSIANSGDIDTLHRIIQTETNLDLKILAVKRLGMSGPKKSAELITQIYTQSQDADVKYAAIHALFLQSNAKGLIAIIERESDPQLKRKALKKLTLIDSDEAIDYFTKILGK